MQYFHYTFKAMGTPCEIQLFAKTEAKAKRGAERVIADVKRLEQRYSRYRADSFLSKINRVAANSGKLKVDAETAALLNYAQTCYEQSDGMFDISSGLLRNAWRFDQNRLPEAELIEQLLARIGWHKLHWQEPVLEFLIPGMELDFGGIVKEYAVDRAVNICWQADIHHGVINLGGDIRLIGPRPDTGAWHIGIKHPRADGVLQSIALATGALASSGDYERCITINNQRYGHVLNPKTGWPVQYLASVSVVADLCVVAGSASTIAMLKEEQGPAWLNSLGLKHSWVTVQGEYGGNLPFA
ncbi:FAD:protein FMN transferase [Methylocucumis oryzae]|uniref:FAD:protein FMN transferase n=1 Tax=Methylocucumis oryzae TaxID=1632867 RepID=A0A0F3II38_9GAMM|nr:FAD:protein FMN transferase [Methylocucumis oryzae]KJV06332.1 thiamine biosynthesis protein ApbE [Methylocucumis oryzae]